MKHPTVEELLGGLREARQGGAAEPFRLEQVRRYRELLADCPTFAPALLELGRLLQLTDEPGVDAEEAFVEIQKLLEQAVQVSAREANAVVELGYFLDTIRNDSEAATKLYEEGAAKALETLEDAWAGLLRAWVFERTKESLEKALRLSELAEKLFPNSGRIQGEVHDARRLATLDGQLKP
jgi:tetratricopeptide (TPR) repeat protein